MEPFSAVFVGGEFAAEEVSQYVRVDQRTKLTFCLNCPQAGTAELVKGSRSTEQQIYRTGQLCERVQVSVVLSVHIRGSLDGGVEAGT